MTIKGLAIACIVYGHLGNFFGIRYLTPLGSIGVAMFLVVSGYGINESWKKNGPHAYWRKRIVSVFLPYAVIELAALPLRGGWRSFGQAVLDLTGIASTYYLGWYMRWILICYTAYYLFALLPGGWKTLYFGFLAFGIGTILFTPGRYAAQSFSFFFGILLSDHPAFCRRVGKWCWRFFTIMFLVGCTSLAVKQLPAVRSAGRIPMNLIEILIAVGFAFAFSLLNYCIWQGITANNRVSETVASKIFWPLWALGAISYEMYLTHGYTLWVVKLSPLGALCFYVLTIGIAACVHVIIKRVQDKVRRTMNI